MNRDRNYWLAVNNELQDEILKNIRMGGSMARWYELNDAKKYALCFAFPKAGDNAAWFKRLRELRRDHFRGFERSGLA